MPRNRSKRPCQHPGCRNWAMRGREFCRVHLAHELGPLGGGAPARNLFGVKDAERATAVPESGMYRIAREIARDPEGLQEHLAPVIRDLQVRAGDPVKALRALQKAVRELIPQVIGEVVALEAGAVLDSLPASQRVSFRNAVIRQARSGDAESTLGFVRRWRGDLGHPGRGGLGGSSSHLAGRDRPYGKDAG